MTDYFLPSANDKKLIQWTINELRKRKLVIPFTQTKPVLVNNTDCHIVKIPEDGIPARADDVPGSEDCPVYRIDEDGGGGYELTDTGIEITVFNVSAHKVPADQYIPVTRTKYGTWIIEAGAAQFRLVKGSVTTAFDDTDTTVDMTSVVVLYGPPIENDPDYDAGTLTVYNTYKHAGANPSLVLAFFDPDQLTWVILLVDNCGD